MVLALIKVTTIISVPMPVSTTHLTASLATSPTRPHHSFSPIPEHLIIHLCTPPQPPREDELIIPSSLSHSPRKFSTQKRLVLRESFWLNKILPAKLFSSIIIKNLNIFHQYRNRLLENLIDLISNFPNFWMCHSRTAQFQKMSPFSKICRHH